MNVKDLTNEELAEIVESMIVTGLAPTWFEKECLKEAAERLKEDSDLKLYTIKRKVRRCDVKSMYH